MIARVVVIALAALSGLAIAGGTSPRWLATQVERGASILTGGRRLLGWLTVETEGATTGPVQVPIYDDGEPS